MIDNFPRNFKTLLNSCKSHSVFFLNHQFKACYFLFVSFVVSSFGIIDCFLKFYIFPRSLSIFFFVVWKIWLFLEFFDTLWDSWKLFRNCPFRNIRNLLISSIFEIMGTLVIPIQFLAPSKIFLFSLKFLSQLLPTV